MEKTITVEIDENGSSTLDLEGFQGKGCGEVAKALQGDDIVTKVTRKREFYIEAPIQKVAVRKRS